MAEPKETNAQPEPTGSEGGEKSIMTAEALEQSGLSAEEIQMAKDHGIVPADNKEEAEKKEEKQLDQKLEPKKTEEKPEAKKIPEGDLDPEKEAEALKGYNANEKALYWAQKKERQKRQAAEMERDHERIRAKAATQELELLKERLARLEEQGKEKPSSGDIDGILNPDGTDKPLTAKDLDAHEAKKLAKAKEEEAAAAEKKAKENERAMSIKARITVHETDARSRYEDFDDVSNLAAEILKNPEAVFGGDRRTLSKAEILIKQAFNLMVSAEELQDGDYTSADAVYELGLLHPGRAKKTPSSGGEKTAKKDGALTPEQLNKMAANAEKTPSASVNGGGGGKVSEDDMTLEDAARLSPQDYARLKPETKQRLLRS